MSLRGIFVCIPCQRRRVRASDSSLSGPADIVAARRPHSSAQSAQNTNNQDPLALARTPSNFALSFSRASIDPASTHRHTCTCAPSRAIFQFISPSRFPDCSLARSLSRRRQRMKEFRIASEEYNDWRVADLRPVATRRRVRYVPQSGPRQ